MCSFGSCQTRFEFLSQFRKVRNAFECFVTQVQTRLPKTKCVWPMKINVICTVHMFTQTDLLIVNNGHSYIDYVCAMCFWEHVEMFVIVAGAAIWVYATNYLTERA